MIISPFWAGLALIIVGALWLAGLLAGLYLWDNRRKPNA